MFHVFISKIEPKTIKISFEHPDWVVAMQAELQVELAEFNIYKV